MSWNTVQTVTGFLYRIRGILFGLALFALVIVLLWFMQGCAAGRADDGSIITGFKIAAMPETAGEFAKAASGFLPPPWNLIAGGAASLLLGGTATATVAARRARAREDAAWDESEVRALRLASPPPQWRGVGPDPAFAAPAPPPVNT